MAANRLQMLNELADKLPAANEKIRAQRQGAIGTGLQGAIQGAVAKAPAGTQTGAIAAPLAAQAAQARGAEALQATQQQQQQAAGLGQEALRTRSVEFQNRMGAVKLGRQKQLAGAANHISSLGRDLKAKLFDNNMQFAQDEQGRKFTNDRQLMDWAAADAKDLNEFKDRMQVIEQAQKRKIMMLEAASARITQAIKQGWLSKEQKLDQEQTRKLYEIESALKKKIAKEKSKAGNMRAIAKGVGTVGGAIAGGVITGTPTGAMVGAQAGGAGGEFVGGFLGS